MKWAELDQNTRCNITTGEGRCLCNRDNCNKGNRLIPSFVLAFNEQAGYNENYLPMSVGPKKLFEEGVIVNYESCNIGFR